MFQTDRTGGHHRSLPTGLDPSVRRPVPASAVSRLAGHRLSARGRARADAQGRCDGVGSEEIGSPSRVQKRAREGFSFSAQSKTKACISLVKLPSGGPGLLNAKTRPAAFAGRFQMHFVWDTRNTYTGKYPIPLPNGYRQLTT